LSTTSCALVVPAPTDPERITALDENAYRRVITRLKDFFSSSCWIAAPACRIPHWPLPSRPRIRSCCSPTRSRPQRSLVAESTELLHQWGKPITVVVNRMPVKGAKLEVARLSGYLPAARRLAVMPDDLVAATRPATGRFDWRDAPSSWQFALRRLATVLVGAPRPSPLSPARSRPPGHIAEQQIAVASWGKPHQRNADCPTYNGDRRRKPVPCRRISGPSTARQSARSVP